jgi:hypothetical protein
MDDDEAKEKIAGGARAFMESSGLFKLPVQRTNAIDCGLWKLGRDWWCDGGKTTDYYELGIARTAFWDNSSARNSKYRPSRKKTIKSNGKSSRYLFEYESRMLFGVFSTCWAKSYERSEGWIYKR